VTLWTLCAAVSESGEAPLVTGWSGSKVIKVITAGGKVIMRLPSTGGKVIKVIT
jgi:hypothetical protein